LYAQTQPNPKAVTETYSATYNVSYANKCTLWNPQGAFSSKNAGLVESVVICICVAKGGATHVTTLEDLYYGNISPHERYIKRGTRVDKLVKLICKNEEELTAGLTEKQKETFEKFKDCTSELSCITEREAFSSGFILATRIMVEVMQGLEEVEDI